MQRRTLWSSIGLTRRNLCLVSKICIGGCQTSTLASRTLACSTIARKPHPTLQDQRTAGLRHRYYSSSSEGPKLRLTPIRPRFRKRPKLPSDEEDGQKKPRHAIPRTSASTEQLEEELRWVAHNAPHPKAVHHILSILIEARGIKPTSEHYEALILANCSATDGSCEDVQAILEQMEREKVVLEAPTYLALLKVLAVHPHAHLRGSILDHLARQSIPLTPLAMHYVAAGAIREGQLESAWLEIEKMRKDGMAVEPWLFVILIRSLCDREDFEGVLHLIYDMTDNRVEIPRSTWSYVLERASQHQDWDVTTRVWQEMVEPMHIKPGLQECIDTLRLAANRGQPWLADSVMLVLKEMYEVSEEHQVLVDEAHKNVNQSSNDQNARPKNLLAFFSKERGLENARFDPWKALNKRPRR